MSDVSIEIAGRQFLGWKEVTITRSLESLCASFNFSYTDAWAFTTPDNLVSKVVSYSNKKWYINAGDACQIFIDGELILTGYVDAVGASIDSSNRNFTASGRDKTCDLVDSSASAERWETWQNLTITQIANNICKKFDITLLLDSYALSIGNKFQSISSNGQTAHEILDDMAKQRGILLTTSEKGELVLTRPGIRRSKTHLIEQQNVISASISVDHKNRFSKYYVYGQAIGDALLSTNETSAVRKSRSSATDEGVSRYRPKITQDDNSTSNLEAQKRVQWQAKYNAAKGTQVNVTVPSWRQGDKASDPLWKVNELVFVQIPSIGINEELLVQSVSYKLSEGGTTTDISLTRTDAWVPDPTVRRRQEPGIDIRSGSVGGASTSTSIIERARTRQVTSQ